MSTDYGEYFKEDEFYCHCGECEFPGMDQELLDKLNLSRESAGIPFSITSGYRCSKFNTEIGGNRLSAHMKGMAADILCTDSSKRFKMIETLQPYFDRIGIASDFIHVDVDSTKPGFVMWTY
jgi:uncharacterized protein YcbK (DUF882 family)